MNIKCQRCKPSDEGCATCGGFKIVLDRNNCPTCNAVYWTRPHARTTYDGKRFFSFDGLEIIVKSDGKWQCARCE